MICDIPTVLELQQTYTRKRIGLVIADHFWELLLGIMRALAAQLSSVNLTFLFLQIIPKDLFSWVEWILLICACVNSLYFMQHLCKRRSGNLQYQNFSSFNGKGLCLLSYRIHNWLLICMRPVIIDSFFLQWMRLLKITNVLINYWHQWNYKDIFAFFLHQ